MTNDDMFKDGALRFHVPGQSGLTRAQQAILKSAVEAGLADSRSVQGGCRMASDVMQAARELTIEGKQFHLNANGRALFGKNRTTDEPFLTLCLIEDATDLRYKFTWSGDAIPTKMVKVAVDHDLGKTVKPMDFELPFADAAVTVTEYVPGRNAQQPRAEDGVPAPAPKSRNYGRCRREDVTKIKNKKLFD